jgi:tight adherence protein C
MNVLDVALATAWATIATAPFVGAARRTAVVRRCRPVSASTHRRRRLHGALASRAGLRVLTTLAARHRARRVARELDAALPTALDLLVVAVGAGATPSLALETAARWAPHAVAVPLRGAVARARLGAGVADALAETATTWPRLAPLAEVLGASARLGAPAAEALARLAGDARADARRRAEARARALPVKLLFPLVFTVLPAFGLLTVAPALISALSGL